ncbi:MAG: hypothetical protein EOO92_05610 [Pedobacter sp.]|nr:MAG: hypothetical protein EOO92_05610 [Pedobacter sp.]
MNTRKTSQPLLPVKQATTNIEKGSYNLFPTHELGNGKIFNGYASLADWIILQKAVLIDGYQGVLFDDIYTHIQIEFAERGILANWHFAADYLKPETEVNELVRPYMGEDSSVWGFKTDLNIKDFFKEEIETVTVDLEYVVNIVIGLGAALAGWDVPVLYCDVPKNEIQYRMRAGAAFNIGSSSIFSDAKMYKRAYFVDWVVCDRYRNDLLSNVNVVADAQRAGEITWMYQQDLIAGLKEMANSVFRVRPWFEKGSWGGQWMKAHIPVLNQEEVNYAWSFELITPENGLVFASDGALLEVSFDFLMLYEYQAVIGKHAALFGPYFPIRFDFLDTFNGGNLSIQCHPSKTYIKEQFGESITQDETYYILDATPDAKVYLGFQDDINPDEFRAALEESQQRNEPLAVDRYVQSFPSNKHDLFLIPNGTVHSSGVNNMVLEISATPYIFTFKMYDWLSLDLNGQPRPINIAHAFNNLRFERKGDVVREKHISKPAVIGSGADWELIHLPTHEDHFYDVHRLEFDTHVEVLTNDSCHVLMLVEGNYVTLKIEGLKPVTFAYAETFVVPAATQKYTLINEDETRAKVIKSFIKDETKL